ncbi:unnamed protein product [Caenorhabditis brenneri]
MNTTTEICTCLMKNATQLLQEEKNKRSSETTLQILVFMIVLMLVMIVCFLAFMVFKAPEYLAKRPKNLTRIPTIPFPTGHFIELSKDYKYLTLDARILVDPTAKCQNWCTNKLNSIMRMIFGIDAKEDYSVPWNTRMISIKMEGFKHGKRLHDFEPMEGAAPGSYFTYQMFGEDTIQVTRYAVGNKSYVAGFCIYVKNDWVSNIQINMDVVMNLMTEEKYPGKEAGNHILDEPVSIEIPNNMQVKYCPRLQKFKIAWEEAGAVKHQEWNERWRKKEEKVCGVCTELLSDPLI